jgi:hypothetical protein
VDLRPLACWDYGFESRRGMDVCLLWVLWCHVEVSASGRSLVQRSPIECSVCVCVWVGECYREASTVRGSRATRGCWVMREGGWQQFHKRLAHTWYVIHVFCLLGEWKRKVKGRTFAVIWDIRCSEVQHSSDKGPLFYQTIHVTLHSYRFVRLQSAQRSLLVQSAGSRDPLL